MSKESMIKREKIRELMKGKELYLLVERTLNDLKTQLQLEREEESLLKEKSRNDSFENTINFWFVTEDIAEDKGDRIKNYFDII